MVVEVSRKEVDQVSLGVIVGAVRVCITGSTSQCLVLQIQISTRIFNMIGDQKGLIQIIIETPSILTTTHRSTAGRAAVVPTPRHKGASSDFKVK